MLVVIAETGAAQSPEIAGEDGWYTWRTPAVDPAPDWCCYDWNAGQAKATRCKLDGRNGFGTGNEAQGGSPYVQLYALFNSGEIKKLWALNAQCPVEAKTTISDLGIVAAEQSIEWLENALNASHPQSARVIAALAAHEGPQARKRLLELASGDGKIETRKEAVFWLAQLRVNEVSEDIKRLMRYSKDDALRQHAAFAYAQSQASDRISTLISVIEDRSLPRSDRKQALFWLANTESDEAMDYLEKLLVNR